MNVYLIINSHKARLTYNSYIKEKIKFYSHNKSSFKIYKIFLL